MTKKSTHWKNHRCQDSRTCGHPSMNGPSPSRVGNGCVETPTEARGEKQRVDPSDVRFSVEPEAHRDFGRASGGSCQRNTYERTRSHSPSGVEGRGWPAKTLFSRRVNPIG